MKHNPFASAMEGARLFTAVGSVALLALSACTTSIGVAERYAGGVSPLSVASAAPPPPPAATYTIGGAASVPEAEALLARGDAPGAVRLYQAAAAAEQRPATAAEFRLRAAEAANLASDPVLADQLLDQIPASPLDARQQARYRLLRAQTALSRNDATRVLNLLPSGDPGGDPLLAERQLQLRAQAQFRSNDAVGGTQSLVLRERYLNGIVALSGNRELLWKQLQGATLDGATLNRAQGAGAVTKGWIELAQLARRGAALGDFEAWRQRYPRHPGEEQLATLFIAQAPLPNLPPAAGAAPAAASAPSAPSAAAVIGGPVGVAPTARSADVALLLPQTGALATLASALGAGYAATAGQPAKIYEPAAFGQAVNDGAGVIVGPLLKEELVSLTQGVASMPVPVLALNYLDANRVAPPGLFQFGLAPEDEARAAADDAFARGFQRALTMTPASDWGNRVQAAFETRLRELGGKVVEAGRYSGEPSNWSDPVRKLLRYVPIDNKQKAAEARAKAGPDIDPQRRNDFDFVFLAGRASQARVLWPLFRYYHADRTPVYATSAVNEGRGDGDLAGIRFCDAPWLLDASGAQTALHDAALSGRNLDAARFYAFGADAHLLASRIAGNALRPGDVVDGATGALQVDPNGAIHRKLVCARITNGGDPFPLPPVASEAVAPATP